MVWELGCRCQKRMHGLQKPDVDAWPDVDSVYANVERLGRSM